MAPFLVKRLELALRERLDSALAESGLTAPQYTLLSDLQHHPELTGADLARRWHLRPQSISETLSALERDGLINRRVSPHHRRQRLISLTGAGAALLDEVEPKVRALHEDMLNALSPNARDTFGVSLVTVRRALEQPG